MSEIHPTAFVDPAARLGANVRIGPFCHVGAHVELGEGCVLHGHATVLGPATLGPANVIWHQCTLGADPQDLKYKGGSTGLVVGRENVFRENVTVHRGTEVDASSGGLTRIGDHNLFMVGVHIAHDSDIGKHVIIANQVQIAGHVRIEDCVTVGGVSAMHHFVTVGRNAYIAGMTRVTHDVPPYLKVEGYNQDVRAVNTTGMRRWNIPAESILAVKAAFRLLYARRGGRSLGRTSAAVREISTNGLMEDEHVRYLVSFLRNKMEIGVYGRVRERRRNDTDADRAGFYESGRTGASA